MDRAVAELEVHNHLVTDGEIAAVAGLEHQAGARQVVDVDIGAGAAQQLVATRVRFVPVDRALAESYWATGEGVDLPVHLLERLAILRQEGRSTGRGGDLQADQYAALTECWDAAHNETYIYWAVFRGTTEQLRWEEGDPTTCP